MQLETTNTGSMDPICHHPIRQRPSEQVVRDISELKGEPEWMTDIRAKAHHHFMNENQHGATVIHLLVSISTTSGILPAFIRSNGKGLGRCTR